jgi:hypothetical protein
VPERLKLTVRALVVAPVRVKVREALAPPMTAVGVVAATVMVGMAGAGSAMVTVAVAAEPTA